MKTENLKLVRTVDDELFLLAHSVVGKVIERGVTGQQVS